ncbi:MAG: HAMP domain-containing histidine kinase [Saccharofermentans sp.]|nr:HAMP domain-containing histidine kinase [Saccharofermentans sp.]
MSTKGKKTQLKLESDSVNKQLMTVLLFMLIFVLVSQIMHILNGRNDSDVDYSYSMHTYFLEDRFEDANALYFEDRWVVVPNIHPGALQIHSFKFSFFPTYAHYENASINSRGGWNNLGPNATLYNSSSDPTFVRFVDDNGKSTNCVAYLNKFKFPDKISTLYLSIPDINGEAQVFCNGFYEGTLGDSSAAGMDFSCGYNSIPLHADANGYAEVVIVVTCEEGTFAPGILSAPSMTLKTNDNWTLVVSAVWYTILIIYTVFFTIGGFIITQTLENTYKFLIFLVYELAFLAYVTLHERYVLTYSVTRTKTCYALVIIMAAAAYAFISSLFSKSAYNKNHPFWKWEPLIACGIGVVLGIVPLVNPSIWSNSTHTFLSFFYAFILSAGLLLKILFFYIKEKRSTLALIAAVTFLFMFVYMHEDPTSRYNIPFYSMYLAIAITVIFVYFFLLYVRQYKMLAQSSDRLRYLVREKTIHISEINRDLYNTNKRLLENEEARKNVLSNVSHDLRTPVTAIRGYAELLTSARKNMKDEQIDTYLSNIIKRSQQMERIVSDIVELTRMESNKNEFSFTDVSMAELLDELYMLYEGDLHGTNKRLTLNIPEDDLLIVKADPKKISRVFENLISNAINYTYDDALIKVSAWREDTDKPVSEQKIVIEISDNGIGIPEEDVAKVFDRFYRAKNSGQNIKGTGLGLSIVKTIIEHHDADISVESRLGSGTTFHIVMKATY